MSDTMRAEFEAWFYEVENFSMRCERFAGPADAAWNAWQAAQSQPAPPAQPSDAAWKLVPVEPSEQMIEAGRHVKRMRLLDSVKAIRAGRDPEELMGKTAGAEYRAMLEAAPAPPAPSSVQEIMRLMMPYVSACGEFDDASTGQLEEAEARVAAAFKPLQAAITALVEKNHELQFSLDGVNAMRRLPTPDQQDISGWWNSVKDSLAWSGAIVGLEWAELWPEAQDMLKVLVKATHGIKPEQGESHE